MKIFVSGQITDIVNVQRVQQALINNGHTITHDWTISEAGGINTMLATAEDKLMNINETSKRAYLDIRGVIDCDLYVICTDNENSGKGMYAELGAALALAEIRNSPKIFLLGAMNHMSLFYFHPLVKRCASIDDLVQQIS